jgi:predicted secreted hydrolase
MEGGALRVGAVLGQHSDDAAFERAVEPRAFVFPDDHGVHADFRSEWWYLTCVLTDDAGHEYGVQFTLFRQALRPPGTGEPDNPWTLEGAYLAHFAITDVPGNRHVSFERLSRGHPALAAVTPRDPVANDSGMRLFIDDWKMDIDRDRATLTAADGEWKAELSLSATLPIIPQGDSGLSRKSANQASHYYSWPRFLVSGSLDKPGKKLAVKGLGWFDHEWSTSVLSDGQIGWAWFSLHLDDGRSVMVFRLRRRDGMRDPFDHGVVVERGGQYTPLTAAEFQLEPQAEWQGPDGVIWPIEWELELDGETLRIRAAIPDQRMRTRISYWEGVVHVLDGENQSAGSGYMELTGY